MTKSNQKPGLTPEQIKRAQALDASGTPDLTMKEIGKATFAKLAKAVDSAKQVASNITNAVIPEDPEERAVREAGAHIRNKNRTDQVRYAVNRTTGWAGAIARGAIRGVYDSVKENAFGKPSKSAKRVLHNATQVETEEK